MDDAIGAMRHATGAKGVQEEKQHMSRAKARAAFTHSRKAATNAMCTVKKQMGTLDVCILEIIRKDVRGEDSNTTERCHDDSLRQINTSRDHLSVQHDHDGAEKSLEEQSREARDQAEATEIRTR